ncbi:glycosyltransferase family 25 protein [Vibrio alfacsensis]|uniref:glycosyltransferase family 25 protein n=1 Tax=Vibrio alfacsensis TaxID=1074311 RepID=UPI001BF0C32C|nr:glycosyltransferase family 25 protein [Vibrio alfacsensis]BCN22999.1 Lex2B [Vibrio alfacsensis]
MPIKIFVINLKESTERREQMSSILSSVNFEFFDAENVKSDPQHSIYRLYDADKCQKYKGYQLTAPELGCWASHIALWRHCVKIQESILILEDNIELFGDLNAQLDNIQSFVNKYGLLKLGNIFERQHLKIQSIDENYEIISNLKGACGTSAYAITPEVAVQYLSQIDGFFEPVDDFMDNEWRTKQTIYSYHPQLVSRSNATSTIGKRKEKNNLTLVNKLSVEWYRLLKQWKQKNYNHNYKKACN